MPGGERVLASVRVLEPGRLPGMSGGYEEESEFEDTAAPEWLGARVERLNELVSGVGSAVLDAAASARPDEVSATFGVEVMAKPGRAVAMLADGEMKGAISVTLTWRPEARSAGREGADRERREQ
nr:CU044_2847 family protein [Streptomyces sp. HNM0575]